LAVTGRRLKSVASPKASYLHLSSQKQTEYPIGLRFRSLHNMQLKHFASYFAILFQFRFLGLVGHNNCFCFLTWSNPKATPRFRRFFSFFIVLKWVIMQSREVGCENPIKQKSCLLCPKWTKLVNKDPPILTRLVYFMAVLVKNASRFLKLSFPLTRKQLKQRYVLSNFSGCPIFCYLAGKQGGRFKNSPGTGEAKFSLC